MLKFCCEDKQDKMALNKLLLDLCSIHISKQSHAKILLQHYNSCVWSCHCFRPFSRTWFTDRTRSLLHHLQAAADWERRLSFTFHSVATDRCSCLFQWVWTPTCRRWPEWLMVCESSLVGRAVWRARVLTRLCAELSGTWRNGHSCMLGT